MDDSPPDVTITVEGDTNLGKLWAEFVAKEVARGIDNLETFEVLKDGDFDTPNVAEERRARFRMLQDAARRGVKIYVRAR